MVHKLKSSSDEYYFLPIHFIFWIMHLLTIAGKLQSAPPKEDSMKAAAQAKIVFSFLIAFLCALACFGAETGIIPFESPRWTMVNARTVDHLGQKALIGTAFLNGADFGDGVIEFDLAVTGVRSYPGILFRTRPDGSWERFYIRPHRAGNVPPPLYTDVVQYVAAFNRVDSWQLYNGERLTAGAVVPCGRWFHVKVEVAGDQARIFLDNSEKPVLQVDRLRHGIRKGGIGLMGPPDGSAYFANFSYRADDTLSFDPPRPTYPVPGVFGVWEISRPFKALQVDMEKTPEQQGLADPAWQAVRAEADGLVDISRFHPRSNAPDLVFARTRIDAETDKTVKLNLGYSDFVTVFLNDRLLYNGASPYQGRDPSFLGIVGFFDTLYLPLQKGSNELLLAVAEVSGGWGFKAQDGNAVTAAAGLARLWETPKKLLSPESAAFDPKTRAIYVSNYDPYNRSFSEGKQSISKLNLEGSIEKLDWVTGLKNPSGVAVHKNTLFVVEPNSLVEIDIAQVRIIRRVDVPGSVMLNDIAVDARGIMYLSDSAKGIIYQFNKSRFVEWLKGPEISRPNGVCVHGKKLIWGNNGDGKLKSADLKTKVISTLAAFGPGIIDGVMAEADGNILVTHNEGRLFRVSPDGRVNLLLDTTVIGQNLADFTFIPGSNLLVFPTWLDNRVTAFRVDEK
jgi:DNA-binding beta-propeller fold protein YncE